VKISESSRENAVSMSRTTDMWQ